MGNQQYSTSVLMEILKTTDVKGISQYSQDFIPEGATTFASYMDKIISSKGLKRQDIFQRADIPQKYGYKLLTGERHTNNRDKILRLFFAMNLTFKEVRRGLELYGMPALYPKIKRDAIFIILFNRGYSSVDEVNRILAEHGETELSRCRD